MQRVLCNLTCKPKALLSSNITEATSCVAGKGNAPDDNEFAGVCQCCSWGACHVFADVMEVLAVDVSSQAYSTCGLANTSPVVPQYCRYLAALCYTPVACLVLEPDLSLRSGTTMLGWTCCRTAFSCLTTMQKERARCPAQCYLNKAHVTGSSMLPPRTAMGCSNIIFKGQSAAAPKHVLIDPKQLCAVMVSSCWTLGKLTAAFTMQDSF